MAMVGIKNLEQLTVRGIASLFGIPDRTLYSWIETELIEPKVYPKRHRTPIILSYWNLLEIGVMVELRSKGCSLQGIRKAIKYIGKMGKKIYERKLIVTEKDIFDCGSLINEKEKSRIISLVEEQGQMFFVDLRQVKQRVNRELEKEKIEVSLK